VEDDQRIGRPVTMKIDENVENVRILVRTESRIGIRDGETNRNNKSEPEKSVCQNGPKESANV
jgi:hypothetical protein